MRIGILGPLEVRDEAARPVEVSGPRLRALLARLAIDVGRAVSAERLLDDLWDGAPPGGNALQALVSRLRAVAGRELVEFGPGGYRLAVDADEVDAVAFERRAAAARRATDPSRRARGLHDALALWRGPALADIADADFAAPVIARLEELRIAAMEDRVDADLAAGTGVPQVVELEELAAAHPLRERLRAQLMRALYTAGRQADALRVYEETRCDLAERLGVDPSPELSAVHVAILRGAPDLTPPTSSRAPALSSAPARLPDSAPGAVPPRSALTNLPSQLTTFVGREKESERVGRLLDETRLVTLTGPGGAGKTRLAGETTARLVDEQPDGVWFVPLAPVSDPGDVAKAVLVALGVPELPWTAETRTPVPPLERLTDFMAAKRMVLVLDNCEHLIDAVASVVGRVLEAAPGVRVLATSREPLGITGESLCPVPSLPLPPDGADAEEAMRYASVRLFADRAGAVRPGFVVDGDTAAHVVAICRALDGIPLAIELAAARLRSLTPAQVAGRLGDRFRLLTGGSRTALPRHRTLRAVVDWSWELLDDVERTVLRRLSVFAGGATPDGATAVCGVEGAGAPDPRDVIDVIAALVDKSLVMASGDPEVRYRLLETVRVYGAERLAEAGETVRIKSAHAAHFVELAERAEPELRRRDQLHWSDLLAAERDNCNAAFRHVLDVRDVPTGLRLVAALAWFWLMRDLEREAGGWAIAVREIAGDTAPPGLEEQYAICFLTAMMVNGMTSESGPTPVQIRDLIDQLVKVMPAEPRHPALIIAPVAGPLFTGDIDGARRLIQGVAEHPDPWVRAVAHVMEGFLAMNDGEIEQAAEQVRAAYEGFRELGDRWGMVLGLSGRMNLALVRGETAEAVRLAEEAYEYAVRRGSNEQGAVLRITVAQARAAHGDFDGARRDLADSIRDTERIGEYADAAHGRVWLSELERREGNLAAARPLLERALEDVEPRRHRADFTQVSVMVYAKLACLVEQEGDLEEAARLHAWAFSGVADNMLLGNQVLATLVEGVAALSAARGEHVRAAELLGTAHKLHGFRDRYSLEARRATAAATEALGAEGFDEAYARGRLATREEALAIVPDGG
ncbi:AfsR/SARP family transcriptional regulator [Actinomadura xylanilytica]|uniref:AfsR/SARP family transcriptional regulator n=1 Tax=Actinomadura xylanilytica TaxID=887459 RepID=UPI00255AC0A8|nr:BTAD domain-containing putative transcriptional regulator [Actinomadura xylanilytica]MDL4777797.1 BTAD domain-containing putative transcriptional regulator [Actinomadura xylanilytica]